MWDKNLSGILEIWRLPKTNLRLFINSSHNASHLAKDEIIKILISSGPSAVTMSVFYRSLRQIQLRAGSETLHPGLRQL